MTALSADRNTVFRSDDCFVWPVATNAVIYVGALVVMAGGVAAPGSTATGLIAVGVAEERANNAGGAAGAISVQVRRGAFRFANSQGADAITLSNLGATAYIVDDNTVALTNGNGTRSAAGPIIDLDAQGVWVRVGI